QLVRRLSAKLVRTGRVMALFMAIPVKKGVRMVVPIREWGRRLCCLALGWWRPCRSYRAIRPAPGCAGNVSDFYWLAN
ncbi:MAG: hypothetical protein QF437_23570, partial [Planctomycetota bacterium]|nr:hypothetical protein [Planctomycetota bacterium]